MPSDLQQRLTLDEIADLAGDALVRAGAAPDAARCVAEEVRSCERDGLRALGLGAMPARIEALRTGRIDGRKPPHVHRPKSGLVCVDARGALTAPAMREGMILLRRAATATGTATLSLVGTETHVPLSLYAESLASGGLVALACDAGAITGGGTEIAVPRVDAVPDLSSWPDAGPDLRQLSGLLTGWGGVLADRARDPTAPEDFGRLMIVAIDPTGLPDALDLPEAALPDPRCDARSKAEADGVDVPRQLLADIINA